jgi:hypothetical protein
MTLHYVEPRGRYIDYLVKMAAKNVKHGVIEEPRVFYDVITMGTSTEIIQGNPDVFINGEQFPIRLTHMSMALRPDFVGDTGLDERLVQRAGLRLKFHDQYYQSRDFVAAPLWINKVVAASSAVTQGTSSWTFDRPNILSARDSLRVEVNLEEAPPVSRTITVSFTGTGLLSGRPYFLSGSVALTDANPTVINTANFRNDGSEPIALTDMTVHCSGDFDDSNGQGDVRLARVAVRQIGNGTQADWFQGPTVPSPVERIPAVLLGYTAGRACVHRFPGEGVLWEPGEGISLDAQALNDSIDGLALAVSLSGYVSLTGSQGA